MGAGRETMKMRWKCHAKPMRNDLKSDEKLWEIHRIGGKMTAKLLEMQFSILFLIVLYQWSTVDYHTTYENMRNENWKSFAGTCPERFYFDTIRANVRLSLIHQYIALSRKDKLVGIWKLPIYSYNNFMSHTYFFVKIVCLLNINCYFCRSLLSSDEGNFLIFLLRTVICYIHI